MPERGSHRIAQRSARVARSRGGANLFSIARRAGAAAITRDLIAAQREIADLTNDRHVHGLAGEPDVDSARAQLASLESQLPPYEQMIATSKHALAVLTGRTPEALDAEFGATGELPELPQDPGRVYRRRWHAGVRTSAIPRPSSCSDRGDRRVGRLAVSRCSIAGTLGCATSALDICSIGRAVLHFRPDVSLPIFHGGALVANVRLSRAQAAEAALTIARPCSGAAGGGGWPQRP